MGLGPSVFELKPTSSSDQPPPAPPRILKHQIYDALELFKEVDNHAILVARKHYHNFSDLIWDLTFSKNFNELQKARAIFRWITLRKLHNYTFDDITSQDSPEFILQEFQLGKLQKAYVYKCMAIYSGLHCVTVRGWTKGPGNKPGMRLTLGPANHVWNAVHIDGNWQLVDFISTAKQLRSQEDDDPDEYNEFYFMPAPYEMVFSHCPEDPAWQLCHPTNTYSKSEFDNFPLVNFTFFTTGMHFLQQKKGAIYTHNGILTLTLGLKKLTALSYTLELESGDDGSDSFQGVPLVRYIIQEVNEHKVTYYFRAPQEGSYYLTVLVQEDRENLTLAGDFSRACQYKIICNKTASEVKPFPSVWCTGLERMQWGLTSLEEKTILKTTNGQYDVTYTKSFPFEMFAELSNDNIASYQLDNAISIEEQCDLFSTEYVNIKCKLPAPGEYGLCIRGRKPLQQNSNSCGDQSYTNICQYLVTYTNEDLQELYGTVCDREHSQELVLYDYCQDTFAILFEDEPSILFGDPLTSGTQSCPLKNTHQMASPSVSDLYPQPISSSDRPPPAPPRILKHQIYTNPQFFKDVDDHAIKVAQRRYDSFRDLMWDLIFTKTFNELQKARAIFQWMMLRDQHNYSFYDNSGRDSPESVLLRFRLGTGRKARAFECLALHAGLHCVTVSGWSKADGYKSGMQLTSKPASRMWNAVHIDGNWQLVDCSSAAKPASDKLKDFYFIPAPSEMIYINLPVDPAWQLCDPTYSKAEFEDYPFVSSTFFVAGLHFLQQYQGVIYTHDGILVLTLGIEKLIAFNFKLEFTDDNFDNSLDIPLERYIIQETTDRRVSYYFRAPREGAYYLTLFVPNFASAACQYKIICKKTTAEVEPFPCLRKFFARLHVMPYDQLVATSEEKAILKTTDGQVDMTFTKSSQITVYGDLRSKGKTKQQLKDALSVEVQGNQVHVRCDLPSPGEYALDIYTRQQSLQRSQIYQYLLTYTARDLQALYGQVYDQKDSSELVRYNYDKETYATLSADLHQRGASGGANVGPSDSEDKLGKKTADLELPEGTCVLSCSFLEDLLGAMSCQDEPAVGPAAPPTSTHHVSIECAVCMDDFEEISGRDGHVMSTKCGHIFCETCITNALEREEKCPTCRKTLHRDSVHRIFLQSGTG